MTNGLLHVIEKNVDFTYFLQEQQSSKIWPEMRYEIINDPCIVHVRSIHPYIHPSSIHQPSSIRPSIYPFIESDLTAHNLQHILNPVISLQNTQISPPSAEFIHTLRLFLWSPSDSPQADFNGLRVVPVGSPLIRIGSYCTCFFPSADRAVQEQCCLAVLQDNMCATGINMAKTKGSCDDLFANTCVNKTTKVCPHENNTSFF